MNIYPHPACNIVMKAPKGEEDTVQDLPVFKTIDQGELSMWSFWKPTPEELEALNSNAAVVLIVYGTGPHPVVAMTTTV